jgi:hypothetical protein
MQFEQMVPEYRTPEIETLRDEDLLEGIGPAQAYTGSFPFGF